jgi:hypothetical protein
VAIVSNDGAVSPRSKTPDHFQGQVPRLGKLSLG